MTSYRLLHLMLFPPLHTSDTPHSSLPMLLGAVPSVLLSFRRRCLRGREGPELSLGVNFAMLGQNCAAYLHLQLSDTQTEVLWFHTTLWVPWAPEFLILFFFLLATFLLLSKICYYVKEYVGVLLISAMQKFSFWLLLTEYMISV